MVDYEPAIIGLSTTPGITRVYEPTSNSKDLTLEKTIPTKMLGISKDHLSTTISGLIINHYRWYNQHWWENMTNNDWICDFIIRKSQKLWLVYLLKPWFPGGCWDPLFRAIQIITGFFIYDSFGNMDQYSKDLKGIQPPLSKAYPTNYNNQQCWQNGDKLLTWGKGRYNVKWRQKMEIQICRLNKSRFHDSQIQSPKSSTWNPVLEKGR